MKLARTASRNDNISGKSVSIGEQREQLSIIFKINNIAYKIKFGYFLNRSRISLRARYYF